MNNTAPNERLFDEAFLRRLEYLAILSRQAMAGQMQGERRSPKRGQSVEFADFRSYVPGDDFRRIDWNAYARLERFFIKLFVEEEDLTIHLLIDTSQSMDWGQPNKLRYAARAAGALGYIALVGLDRVTVTALGGKNTSGSTYFPPVRGKQSTLSLFSFLQNLSDQNHNATRPQAALHPAGRLAAYAAKAQQPGPLIVFSDLMDDGWRQGLNTLAGRGFDITVIHILSPDEDNPQNFADPPLAGDFKLLDSENNAALEITADAETLERYRQGLLDWKDDLSRYCTARRIHYAPITSALPLEELLFAWLRRQGVLR